MQRSLSEGQTIENGDGGNVPSECKDSLNANATCPVIEAHDSASSATAQRGSVKDKYCSQTDVTHQTNERDLSHQSKIGLSADLKSTEPLYKDGEEFSCCNVVPVIVYKGTVPKTYKDLSTCSKQSCPHPLNNRFVLHVYNFFVCTNVMVFAKYLIFCMENDSF